MIPLRECFEQELKPTSVDSDERARLEIATSFPSFYRTYCSEVFCTTAFIQVVCFLFPMVRWHALLVLLALTTVLYLIYLNYNQPFTNSARCSPYLFRGQPDFYIANASLGVGSSMLAAGQTKAFQNG